MACLSNDVNAPMAAIPQPDGDRHLPAPGYYLLAVLAGAIGLCASYVTVRLFAAAIQSTETDAGARDLLMMTAALFVVAELSALFLAGLLPVRRLRSLRWQLTVCAAALVTVEAVSIYGARVALVQSADARATARDGRLRQLRASIEAGRRSADALLTAGQRSSQSVIASSRADGAQSLRQAVALEADIQRMAGELAHLEAARAPTPTAVFGEAGVVALAVAQSLLISGIGLIFLGAAGALARAARDTAWVYAPGAATATPAAAAGPATWRAPTVAAGQVQGLPGGAVAAVVPSWGRYASAATAGLATLGAAPAPAAPMQPNAVAVLIDAVTDAVQPTPDASTDAAPPDDDAARFQRVKSAIQSGRIKPSLRGIYAAEGASQQVAARYLSEMERAGLIVRAGRGYALTMHTPINA